MDTVLQKLNIAGVRKLAREVDVAAKKTARNRFLIETYLSMFEARTGKRRSYASVDALFKRLKI